MAASIVSRSSIAANIADHLALEDHGLSLALVDTLAWVNDGGEIEDYPGPGWDADAYEPSPRDWQEYSRWSRSLDGGCGMAELSPDERDLLAHSMSEDQYWDEVAEYDSIHAEHHCDAELWS